MTEKKQDRKSGTAEPNSFVSSTVTLEVALQLADMVVDGLDSKESSYDGIRSMKYDILDTIQSSVNDGLNQIDLDLLGVCTTVSCIRALILTTIKAGW